MSRRGSTTPPAKLEASFSELEQKTTLEAVPNVARVEGGYHVEVDGENTAHLKLAKNGHVSILLASRSAWLPFSLPLDAFSVTV